MKISQPAKASTGAMIAKVLFIGFLASAAPPLGRLPVAVEVSRNSNTEFAVFAEPAVMWKCGGGQCSGTVDSRPAAAMSACKGVARKMTRVLAFRVAGRSFDENELLTCNGGKVDASP